MQTHIQFSFITLLIILSTQSTYSFLFQANIREKSQLAKMSVDNNDKYLTPITPDQVKLEIKDPVDPTALSQAKDIIKELRTSTNSTTLNGSVDPKQLMAVAKKLGDIPEDINTYIATKEECKAAFDGLSDTDRTSLVNIHARVSAFANAQRNSVQDCEIDIPGGKAGHTVSPCKGKAFMDNFSLALFDNGI